MDHAVRLRPYLTQDELLEYLHSGSAEPASAQRRLRDVRLLSAGTRLRPRRADGRVAAKTRCYSALNLLAEALVRAGRNDDAAAVARCATRFEEQFAHLLTPTGEVSDGATGLLSEALEASWASCRPADVTELRGIVTDIGDFVQLRTATSAAVLIPRAAAPASLKIDDGIVVIQIKTEAAGTWLSRAVLAEPVAANVDAGSQHDVADASELFGPDHIEHATRSSHEREQVFDRLASLADEQEPSRLTLLG